MIQIDVLTREHSVWASLPKPGLSNRTRSLPFVTRLAQPLTMNAIARVAIKALMRNTVSTMPLAEAHEQAGADAEQHRHGGIRLQRDSAPIRRPPTRSRADGEIDAAGDEHQRPGRGDDQDRRLLVEDVEQIGLREEGIARRGTGRRRGSTNGMRIPTCVAERPDRSSPESAWSGGDPPADRSANAAARIADLRHGSPSSSATKRPARMTMTRCASPRISSSSDEMSTIAMPASAARSTSSS